MNVNMNRPTESIRGLEVLLVHDSPEDVRLTQDALCTTNDLIHSRVVADGMEDMHYLKPSGAGVSATRPDLMLLDLNLPRMDGRQVLAQIKDDAGLRMIPTVILTTSEGESDVANCYQLHANCHLNKPVLLCEFEDLVKVINDFWLTKCKLPQRG